MFLNGCIEKNDLRRKWSEYGPRLPWVEGADLGNVSDQEVILVFQRNSRHWYSVQVIITDAERPRGFKSRRSPQGMAVALCKDCNAGLDPLGRSLWENWDRASGGCSQPEERAVALGCKRPGTSRKAVVRGVAPLGKSEGHSRRGAPCAQPLPNSLHP